MNARAGVVLVWWLTCLLWSSTFLFIRVGLRELPPLTFAWVRLATALTVLAPVAIMAGRRSSTTRRESLTLLLSGVMLLGINYGLLFWGAQFVPSGLIAILQSGTPILALAFGWMLGSERVTARKLVVLVAGLAGVTIICGTGARSLGRAAVVGSAAILAGSACVALAYVWLKTFGQHLPRSRVTALQTLGGMLPLACLGLLVEGVPVPVRWSASTWEALLYLALVASVCAFWLNYWLLQRMDASAMLMMGVAEVPIAIGLGALILGERLPPGALFGGGLILGAVLAGVRRAPDLASDRAV